MDQSGKEWGGRSCRWQDMMYKSPGPKHSVFVYSTFTLVSDLIYKSSTAVYCSVHDDIFINVFYVNGTSY